MQASTENTKRRSTSPFMTRQEAIQANRPIIEKVKAVVQAFERKYRQKTTSEMASNQGQKHG